MLKYILKRIGLAVIILIGVSMIIYFLIRLMPVDFIQDKINALRSIKDTGSIDEVKAKTKDLEQEMYKLSEILYGQGGPGAPGAGAPGAYDIPDADYVPDVDNN